MHNTRAQAMYVYTTVILALLLAGMVATAPVAQAADRVPTDSLPNAPANSITGTIPTTSDGPAAPPAAATSHRLIVQLSSPSLVESWYATTSATQRTQGPLDINSATSQNYVNQLRAEQTSFVQRMQATVPNAQVSTYFNENNQTLQATYQIVFNGLSVEAGAGNTEQTMRALAKLPGVKAVYPDYAHFPALYTSTLLINAPAAWNAVGGQANGGRGVKVASMDGGLHKDAPMFAGTGYTYPVGFPPNGLGLTANNNGKIIASRAYFRSWDPPAPGDENPWPGTNGTPHGVHTGGIAGGKAVIASYAGITVSLSGVAPAAWMMSYRVFYASINGNESFFDTEGIAALEDIARDGAQVLNNSWGEGPTAVGGQFDPLDQALINTAKAGVFVSMSAGNAGPGNGTTDHPSNDYINVAASSTSGTYASGRVNVALPLPISSTLQNVSYAQASFGGIITVAQVFTYPFTAASVVSPANGIGCNPWPAGTFTGRAAVIARGTCEFGVKVLNAENAGATFVVIYNSAAGGEGLINMGEGAVGNQVTIPSIFIPRSKGLGMNTWYAANGLSSTMTIDTFAFQAGNVPDVIASFSSRGPGVGNILNPDIAAPGVNILSQGYTPQTIGEARHLGFGQASGTSMAAPHVAGAAALLRQIHPSWSNAYIKSALMSTAKYLDVYVNNAQTIPAQPLDMGAGRLDLTNAANPGIILDPPSLSYGLVLTGTNKTIQVKVTSVATQSETYNLSTLYTGSSFTATTALPGFTVSPNAITLAAGASAMITVTFNSPTSRGLGDNQGYIILDGTNYDGHMPAWARVTYVAPAQVLLIDNDGSVSLGRSNYLGYYTRTLTNLGLTYNVLDVDVSAGASNYLNTIDLLAYPIVIYFSGNNYQPNGTFSVPTPLTVADLDRLTEYVNSGGILLAMGQDLASLLNATSTSTAPFFYSNMLGATYLQDSVSNDAAPTTPLVSVSTVPAALRNLSVNVSAPRSYVGAFSLSGAQEAPTPVTTTMTGQATINYDVATRLLRYTVVVSQTPPYTLTAAHIHSGTIGVAGNVLYPLSGAPATITSSNRYTLTGSVILSAADASRMLAGRTYINVHTDVNPGGEIRGQLIVTPIGDGAGNQLYIDEIHPAPPGVDFGDPNNPLESAFYVPLLKYPGATNIEDGVTAVAHRAQPFLERPGISYFGRSIYTTFGLEGVNNGLGGTSREALLRAFLNWAQDNPTVTISNTTSINASQLTSFAASLTSNITTTTGVTYRWDFGDGSPIAGPYQTIQASHMYSACGLNHTVRVEATDSYGNRAIGTLPITVAYCAAWKNYLPLIMR